CSNPLSLLLLFPLSLFLGLSATVEVQRPRGVPLSKRQFYEEGKPFTCLDGSRTVPFDRVNDDYCDCKDGSDEPGTAACPNGSFHCTNAGHRPAFIPSSRINDGICDCCDTTDEYNSGATCKNTCREMGRRERESLQKLAEITKEGFLLKQQLIEEAKRKKEEKQSKLTELQAGKRDVEEKVEALRTVKETAEQPEKEAKERHLKAWEEQKAVIRMEKDKAKMAEAFLELDDDKELSFDFGPSAEFTYLYSQCYELTTSEYIYKICPFNRVSQKPKFGGSETNLGSWGSWAGPDDNKYTVMKYEHGTGCWQGPSRSTTVKLTCGKETTVTSTSEPSRCEYLMEFTTPAVCQEPLPVNVVHVDGHSDHVEL
uniref:Glucosidase 2 subunit beta n=1 Tax=Denticeps clupeoides TaxID=299321 RepID=A0AAY4BUW8_9TELE